MKAALEELEITELSQYRRQRDKNVADGVPLGWKTAKQIWQDDNRGLSDVRVRSIIKEMFDLGVFERARFRIIVDDRLAPVWHYRENPNYNPK